MRNDAWLSFTHTVLARAPSANFLRFAGAELWRDLWDKMSEKLRKGCHTAAGNTATYLSLSALCNLQRWSLTSGELTAYAQSPSGRITHVTSLAPRTRTLANMRIMLDVHALISHQWDLPVENGLNEWGTYNAAVAKTAETPIFFLRGICSLKTQIIGKSSRMRSEAALITDVMILTLSIFMQWPGVCGFQNLRLGEQTKMATNMMIV